MRSKFDQELERLNNELIEMGALIEQAISNAVKAIIDQDMELAKKAGPFDDEIDQKEKDIEAMCLKLLLRQQPVASDLRLISSALKMITDMERIGDQAADISEIALMIGTDPHVKKPEHIAQMASATIKMVNDSIDAFVKRDVELASSVIRADDHVDGLFDTIKEELTDLILENVDNSSGALDLLMVAKYFERIGDHATNIAEWVLFSITGTHKAV